MKNRINIIVFAALIALSLPCSGAATRATHVWPDSEAQLQFHLDEQKGSVVLYDGAIVMPSFFGRIEHYQRGLSLRRERLASGPWRGLLTGRLDCQDDGFSLSGQHDKSLFLSDIRFVDRTTFELTVRFKSTIALSGLSIEIFKLSSNLFKNALVDAAPADFSDIHRLPLKPRDIENRFLLKSKNSIHIKSPVCDIQVTDLRGAHTLNTADFRSVPWDRHKSFYFYTDLNLLPTDDWIEMAYRVQFSPPSIYFNDAIPNNGADSVKRLETAGCDIAAIQKMPIADPVSFFAISPRYQQLTGKRFEFTRGPTIQSAFPDIARHLADDLQTRFFLSPAIKPIDGESLLNGIRIQLLSKEEIGRIGLPAEGFQIEVTSNQTTVSGVDERGCLFGVYALSDLITAKEGKQVIPCGIYRDWPDLPIRAACLELLPSVFMDANLFKSYLRAFSRARANTVIFHHTPLQLKDWKNQKTKGQQWSPETLSAVAAYARTLKMGIWAGLIHKLHPRDFPEHALPGTNFYDPGRTTSFDFLFAQYRTLIEQYDPTAILIGHDEIVGLRKYAALYGKTEAEILADSINKIHRGLQSQQLKTLIWGDMLLDHRQWQHRTGDANSSHPMFRSGCTAAALRHLDRDIVIIDWHYKHREDYPSIGYFRDAGFKVLGCSWHDPAAAISMARSVKQYGGRGVVATDWGFWRTLSPSATTLYSPLSGWHTDIEMGAENADVRAFASSLRQSLRIDGLTQTPVSLSSIFNSSTLDEQSGDKIGFFDLGPIVDLRSLPTGTLRLAGIEFLLPSSADGKPQNCLIIPEKGCATLTLPPAQRTSLRAIGFIQTCYSQQPQYRSRKLGSYAFTYTDGTIVEVDIIEGWNITDIRSTEGLRTNDWSFDRAPDVLIGAYPAWRGRSAADIPLNLQMWLWANPHPEKTLKTITIQMARTGQNAKIAILAATAIHE